MLAKVRKSLKPKRVDVGEVDYEAAREDIMAAMDDDSWDDGSYAPILIRLGWHSSGTFDESDGSGGSNGAGMRFSPERDDPENAGLEAARKRLEPIKKKHPGLSFSDLWILAAYCALERTGGPKIEFTPGRVDKMKKEATIKPGRLPQAEFGVGEELDDQGRVKGWEKLAQHVRDVFYRMGFNDREIVVLLNAHVYGRCHPEHSGYAGAWVEEPTKFSNEYAADMLEDEWMYVRHDTRVDGELIPEEVRPAPGHGQYIGKWSPSDKDEIEAAQVTDFPPGKYKVVDDWINVRRTHEGDSDVIDQPVKGTEFNVVLIRQFKKGVRGQLLEGGWASIVSTDGEPLMERIGDLELEPAVFRILDPNKVAIVDEVPGSAEELNNMEFAAGYRNDVRVEEYKTVQGTDSIFGFVPKEKKWISLSNPQFGLVVEQIVPGYNDKPRKAMMNGGKKSVRHQMMLVSDMILVWDPEFRKHLEEFAADEDLLKDEFGRAFKKLTELGVPGCPALG